MSFSELLFIIAFIVFVVAAIGLSYKKTDLIAVGLALWSLAELIPHLSSISLSVIFQILAFVAFVLAAIGWEYRKIGMIAVGLALWMAAIAVLRFIHEAPALSGGACSLPAPQPAVRCAGSAPRTTPLGVRKDPVTST